MYYIDGNNLAGAIPEVEVGTPRAEAYVIRLVQTWARRTGKKVTLVFDGHRQAERSGAGIRLLYPSAEDASADDVLRRLILQDEQRRNATLVSSDGELVQFAKAHGVQHQFAREFARMLKEVEHGIGVEQAEQKPPAPREHEIEGWMKFFGFGPGGNRRK